MYEWIQTRDNLTYLCMQKPAESIPNNNTQKCEWSVVHRLVITTCKDIQQSTTNIQHCNKYLFIQKEKREREKKREKKKEGKRTNKANTQTKQPWRNIPNNNIQSFLISIYELAKRNNVRISNIVVTTHLAVQYHTKQQY